MMSRFFVLSTLILAVFSFTSVAAAQAPLKIATINIQEALNQVDQGKKAKEDLKKEFEARQKKLDLQQEELKKMQEDLEKKRLVLSQSDLKAKEEKFSQKYMELQKNFGDYRQEIATKEAQFTAKIVENLRVLCGEIGKKEGYQLVVENSQGQVLYASEAKDLTDQVVKEYNKRFKGILKIN